MTFKEYLKFHDIKITGFKKPIPRYAYIEHRAYETKENIPYVYDSDRQMLRALSLYVREHVNSVSATSADFVNELNNSYSLKGYKKLIQELDIDFDIMEFKHGFSWAVERLSLQRDIAQKIKRSKELSKEQEEKYQNWLKQQAEKNYQKHKDLKQAIKDFSGKELD